ncbi:hypothetical protein AsAng_0038020 [Aureispira anguillae]|uniref:Uncharacterized protein n=1 Tax=Aureispira anguillae TaxID=2864201 RepID=A0A916DT96_9BACT|nr:hypothetical protein AsAng_0038020 [Aureispira anguillae]
MPNYAIKKRRRGNKACKAKKEGLHFGKIINSKNQKHMKNLKKTRAKLGKDEQILGKGIPDSLLNQSKLKKLGKLKTKSKSKRK